MNTTEHIAEIIGFLNEKADYAVLRNFEGLPDRNSSRDIDIIISRKSYNTVKCELVELIDRSGWKIITYLNSDRLITFVCATSSEEKTEIVQWDFFFDTSVWGIRLMGAEEFLKYKQFNGFLWHTSVECSFLDKYLYNRAVGSLYPEKYNATRAAAEHAPVVEKKTEEIFGCKSVAECDSRSRGRLVMQAIWANIKARPLSLARDMMRFVYTFARNYICSNTGFGIGFTGPDGSGKTTIIDTLLERIAPVFGKAHKYFHFRPTLFGNIGDVAQQAGIKKEVDRNYSDPHRGGRTSLASSIARLVYYSVDYIAGYFIKIKPATRITRVVVFDRYYTDIICDSRRSRICLSKEFLYFWGRIVIPSLDYNILLTASSDTILARKRELDKEGIDAINENIDFLCGKGGYRKFMNEGNVTTTVHEILSYIFEEQHRKNLRRLRR